jgi:hypothetical protein
MYFSDNRGISVLDDRQRCPAFFQGVRECANLGVFVETFLTKFL